MFTIRQSVGVIWWLMGIPFQWPIPGRDNMLSRRCRYEVDAPTQESPQRHRSDGSDSIDSIDSIWGHGKRTLQLSFVHALYGWLYGRPSREHILPAYPASLSRQLIPPAIRLRNRVACISRNGRRQPALLLCGLEAP